MGILQSIKQLIAGHKRINLQMNWKVASYILDKNKLRVDMPTASFPSQYVWQDYRHVNF